MQNRFLLLASAILTLSACQKQHLGVAQQAVDELYPKGTLGKGMYSESMIRAAAKGSKMNDVVELTKHIAHIYTFEKAINDGAEFNDSLILMRLAESELSEILSFSQNLEHYSLFALAKNNRASDLVLIVKSPTGYKLYEAIGDIPLDLVLKMALSNREQLLGNINFE